MAGLWLRSFCRGWNSRCGRIWTVQLFTHGGLGLVDHSDAANHRLIGGLDLKYAISSSAKERADGLCAQSNGCDGEEAEDIHKKLQFHCRLGCREMVSIGLKPVLSYPATP